MFLADTLSRAPLAIVHTCNLAQELEEVDQTASLALPAIQLQRIQDIASSDPVMTALRDTVRKGWPALKSELSECLYPYYDI